MRLCCVMSAATAAVPEGNKRVCSSYGSSSPSSLLAHTLPTLGSTNSANRVNSETIDATNKIKSDTYILKNLFCFT